MNGESGLETFCGYMNISSQMTKAAYSSMVKNTLLPVYKRVIKSDMCEASDDLPSKFSSQY